MLLKRVALALPHGSRDLSSGRQRGRHRAVGAGLPSSCQGAAHGHMRCRPSLCISDAQPSPTSQDWEPGARQAMELVPVSRSLPGWCRQPEPQPQPSTRRALRCASLVFQTVFLCELMVAWVTEASGSLAPTQRPGLGGRWEQMLAARGARAARSSAASGRAGRGCPEPPARPRGCRRAGPRLVRSFSFFFVVI